MGFIDPSLCCYEKHMKYHLVMSKYITAGGSAKLLNHQLHSFLISKKVKMDIWTFHQMSGD